MVKLYFRRIIIFAIIGLVLALVVGLFSPKVYEARSEMLLGSDDSRVGGPPRTNDEIEKMLQTSQAGSIQTEAAMLKSEAYFYPAVFAAAGQNNPQLNKDVDRLYLMYDVQSSDLSRVIQLRVKAYSKDEAVAIAKEIYNGYVDGRSKLIDDSVGRAQDYLKLEVARTLKDLKDQEQRIEKYKSTNVISDYGTKTIETTRYETALTQSLDQSKAQLSATQTEISRLRAAIKRLPRNVVSITIESKSPAMQLLENQRAEYQKQRFELLRIYTATSSRVRDVDKLIDQIDQKIIEERQNRWTQASKQSNPEPVRAAFEMQLATSEVKAASIGSQIAAINRALTTQKGEQVKLSEHELTLGRLTRDLQITDARYRQLKTQYEALLTRKDTTPIPAVQLESEPRALDFPVSPDFAKLAFLGIVGGICLGVLYSIVMESMKLRVSTSSQLAELTGLPVAATVPCLPARASARLLSNLVDQNGKPVESFRYMAFSTVAKYTSYPKVLLFTSTGNTVGSAASASQFALASAQSGLRTLLVDADLSRPSITRTFEATNRSGVSDILSRTLLPSDQSDLVMSTIHANLFLMPAGTENSSVLADYETSHISALLESVKSRADIIVINVPSCDIIADASRLAKFVDEVFLVLSARSTQYRSVPIAYDILRKSGAKEVSLILLDASAEEEAFSRRASSANILR